MTLACVIHSGVDARIIHRDHEQALFSLALPGLPVGPGYLFFVTGDLQSRRRRR